MIPVRKKLNHERWLISYADLLTLLLALFIVLYASSNSNKAKIDAVTQGFVQTFQGQPMALVSHNTAGRGIMPHQVAPMPTPVRNPSPKTPRLSQDFSRRMLLNIMSLREARDKLQPALAGLIAQHKVSMTLDPLKLTIQVKASVLFQNGQATLMPQAVTLLTKIAGGLTMLPSPFSVTVQGYTDNVPITTDQFPSNWMLSAARAVSVVQLLQNNNVGPSQLSAQGFGDNDPIADNATDAGRATNRRVVIVIQAPDPGNGVMDNGVGSTFQMNATPPETGAPPN
jgi:chemotaxis protein MotB